MLFSSVLVEVFKFMLYLKCLSEAQATIDNKFIQLLHILVCLAKDCYFLKLSMLVLSMLCQQWKCLQVRCLDEKQG